MFFCCSIYTETAQNSREEYNELADLLFWRLSLCSGRKNVLRNLLRIPYRRLKAGFSVCWLCSSVCLFVTERVLTKNEWNSQGVNLCFSKSLFTLVWLLFFVTWNYFGLGTTGVKRKTDHPVSLRWNKKFWTFPKRRVFFWLSIRFIVSSFRLLSRAELKPAYFFISKYFFTCPDSFPLQNHLYPSLIQSKNHFVRRKTSWK